MLLRRLVRFCTLGIWLASVFGVACLGTLMILQMCGVLLPWFGSPEEQQKEQEPVSHFLVVLVMSAPVNEPSRQTVRDTWFHSCLQDRDIRCYFVVGTAGVSKEMSQQLEEERNRHHDMLLIPDVVDTFANLTLKVLKALVWAKYRARAEYVMKCDDDTFVRLPQVMAELKEGDSAPSAVSLYWGFFDGRASVQRKGKWQESDWILCDRYIPYALGGGYVLGSRLLNFIAVNRHELQLYYNEDVSVGTWLAPLKNVRRVHDPRFDTEYKSRGCHNSYLVTHKKSAEEMAAMWRQVKWGSDQLCPEGREVRLRLSYRYNWSVLPSLCCKRHDPTVP